MKSCEKCDRNCTEVGNGAMWYCADCKLIHVDGARDTDIYIKQ